MKYLKHKKIIKHRWRDEDDKTYYFGEVERDVITPLFEEDYQPKDGEEVLDEKSAVSQMWFSTGDYESAPTRIPSKFYSTGNTKSVLGHDKLDKVWENPDPPAFYVPNHDKQLEILF